MKKILFLLTIASGLLVASCSRKAPAFVNSIPEETIAVVSVHPMQIHSKGQLNTLEHLKQKVRDEVWSAVLNDPLSTGLDMNEYSFLFVFMEEGSPVIGVVSGMKNEDKFIALLEHGMEGIRDEFKTGEGFTYVQPETEGIVGWNDEQVIALAAPDPEELPSGYLETKLSSLFHPVKEESVASIVDFKDFLGNMKDLNFWVSSADLQEILKELARDDMEFDFPMELYGNYAQVYVDFADGEMKVDGETHFSEEVEKNLENVLVMNPSLNKDMLELAPGNDLLLGLALSLNLEKASAMFRQMAPTDLGDVGSKVESATGVPAKDLLEALTGDITLAVNGVEGQSLIPVELFIGLGVNSEAIQEKLMDRVDDMAPVEKSGDFFVINFNGNEIYSGIVNNTWILTNCKGYQSSIEGGGLEKTLLDSRFADFADGSSGLFLNLDLSSYPAMLHSLLASKPVQSAWVEKLTGSFESLGASGSNYESHMVLKTTEPGENSLYTILKMTEPSE
ncbi:MAG: DUF4836 family protein [Bacteroidales bacterium]